MASYSITLTFDSDHLANYTDEHLATLWHAAQANPAEHGDPMAGRIVEKVSYEIIRRWLGKTTPEMYGHKVQDHYWETLRRFAKYVPPDGVDQLDSEWLRGTWLPRHSEEAS